MIYLWDRNYLSKIKAIKPLTIASTGITKLGSSTYGGFFNITLFSSTGGIYLSPLSTAPTTTNSYYLGEGKSLALQVESQVSLFGDSTTATYQAIIWDMAI